MRWVAFTLLMGVLLTLQSALAPCFDIWGSRPDWLLVVLVFFAMYGRMPEVAVGAWIVGACADLMTIERMGLIALSYLGAVMLVASIREYLFRARPLTQFIVTFVTCLLLRTTWMIYSRVLYDLPATLLVDLTVGCLLTSLYTAAWAPLFHRILWPMSGLFGLARPRYSYAGLQRADRCSV